MTREAGMVLQHDLKLLRAEQAALKEDLDDLQAREAAHAANSAKSFDQLSRALQGMGSSARLADADVGTQLERMGQDLQDLRGAIEVNEHRIGESESKIQQSLGDRLDQLAKQVAQAGEARASSDGSKLPRDRGRALAAAMARLKAGQGAAGRAMLRAVIKAWPNTLGTSDEAFYRLGDSLAGELGCEQALRDFIAVIERFPKSPWVDDAYYKIGVCSQSLGRLPDAQAFLGELVARYPQSPWRADAQKRLQAMKVAGRANRAAKPAAGPAATTPDNVATPPAGAPAAGPAVAPPAGTGLAAPTAETPPTAAAPAPEAEPNTSARNPDDSAAAATTP